MGRLFLAPRGRDTTLLDPEALGIGVGCKEVGDDWHDGCCNTGRGIVLGHGGDDGGRGESGGLEEC